MKKNEKKVFLSLVALLLILQFSCCSFNDSISASASTYESTANANLAATKNNSKNSVNIEDDFEGDNKISLEPCYGDYEIIKPNIALYSADATQDQYEENNSFLQAKQLPNSNGRMEDYYFSIYATLHRNEWLWGLIKRDVDEDYYRFDLMGNATINITLSNIPTNCDYDLQLYQHSNAKFAGYDDINLIKESKYASSTSEKIQIDVEPGTYYLRVYPYNNTFNASAEYNLSGSIHYTSTNASISDLRFNKGAKAAMWVSDYDPFYYAPLSTFEKEGVGVISYDLSGSLFPVNNESYNNPYFSYMSGKDRIVQTTFYLWDDEWRQEIYDFLTDYEYALTNIVKDNIDLRAKIEKRSEIRNGVSAVTGIVLNLCNLKTGTSFAYTIFDKLFTGAPAVIAQILHPEAFDTTQFYLLKHVQYLKNAFERSLNPTTNEVIKVTSSYQMQVDYKTSSYRIYYCNFAPTYDHNGYSTVLDTIDSYTENTIFRGSTYPIRDENDLHNALSKNGQYFADTNTGGDEELLLDNYYVEPKNLVKGQYYWYHFTAPDAGNYKFFTISQMDTYGEIFEQIVPARSEAGRLAYNDDSGDVLNFSITYSLRKNQTIYLRVHGFGWNATGAFTPMVMFDSPLEEINQIIRPADLGYKNVYVNEVTTDTIELENGFSFNTERYRCGYINNQYLALSAKRKDVDSAWVELDFNKNLNSIDFYIGLWSNEEYINSSNAYILFQYSTTDGKWVDGIEFDLNTISKNKDSLDHFTYTFTSNVTKVRFYVHTNQVNYEKNKGRVVIGDISIAYSK